MAYEVSNMSMILERTLDLVNTDRIIKSTAQKGEIFYRKFQTLKD
jgi:hypothetical protein